VRLLPAIHKKIGNELILNAFKNNFDRFLVFLACFENIMQQRKYVEPKKKKKRHYGYDLKIALVINAHKKHFYVFLFMIQ